MSVCGATRSSDRISRRKTPMLATSRGTDSGPEPGHIREMAPVSVFPLYLSHGGITAQMGFYCDPK